MSDLAALQRLRWVGWRDGSVELVLWFAQQGDHFTVGVVAVLHHLVCLYGLVQNAAEVSSLWEGEAGVCVCVGGWGKRDRGRKEDEPLRIVNTGEKDKLQSLNWACVWECTCAEGLVQISRGGSVPALAELGSQFVVCRLFTVQHLQRLKTTQHTNDAEMSAS